jgi:hypothetical protein
MSVERNKRRKLGFEQLETKSSPTGAVAGVSWAGCFDTAAFHARGAGPESFVRFIADSVGSVSIARGLPTDSEVAFADTMLAQETVPTI